MQENFGCAFLKKYFGYDSFRPYQEEIIREICRGRDVFAVMPTGGGKSLCYQYPAILLDGVCVVVSPLLSLMKDQVDSAKEIGIRAATINSATDRSEYAAISDALETNQLDLLYISPERFNSPGFLPWVSRGKVSFFAVDEAHCISQWGHHFRKDYLALSAISETFPKTPIAAFTATATEEVARDIVAQLKLRDPYRVRASFDRPNLYYQILPKDEPRKQLTTFLQNVQGESGIVYCGTRKKVEEIAEFLVKEGHNARAYHAGLSDEERAEVQDAFAKDRVPIIAATIAFGMGVDKSNVRFVVHMDLPKNIESYYQETGRAGRDGSPARCLLLYDYRDFRLHEHFLEEIEDPKLREVGRRQLREMIQFAEKDQCRRKSLLAYFGEEYAQENCGNCDICTGGVIREDATIESQKALSAMERTGNRFGIGHIIDILVGAETEKITRFGHHQIKTFGVGKDKPKKYWRLLINSLILKGYARVEMAGDFPTVGVTESGWRVMRGQERVELIRFPMAERSSKKDREKKEKKEKRDWFNEFSGEKRAENQRLFEILRQKRMEIAQDRGVPPYIIFTDKSLLDMTILRPKDDTEFLLVNGVGESKLRNYGETFLELIKKFEKGLLE